MREKLELRVFPAPWRRCVDFYAFTGNMIGTSIAMKENNDPSGSQDSAFSLDMVDAQVLMDDLWNCGLRPTEGSGSAGAMAAVQSHIADLRAVAFKALGIDAMGIGNKK